MQTKTNELTGAALDWAVAKCEGDELSMAKIRYPEEMRHFNAVAPSKYWDQGGPIIEREAMNISRTNKTREEPWAAYIDGYYWIDGPTLLIAAMRCYVASRLGDEVDIPEELLK
jgi:hypothetical protein